MIKKKKYKFKIFIWVEKTQRSLFFKSEIMLIPDFIIFYFKIQDCNKDLKITFACGYSCFSINNWSKVVGRNQATRDPLDRYRYIYRYIDKIEKWLER